MRFPVLLTAALLSSPAVALACANDYSGTQRTLGYDYEIEAEADLARTTLDFLDAASNWLYFTTEGSELRDEFVFVVRIRDLPIHLPACNDIGQCASISVRSEPYRLFGVDWPGIHSGFTITATFNGDERSRFIQADSAVANNKLSADAAADKRCRNNRGELIVDDSDDEEFSEDEEEDYDEEESDWEDEFEWEDEFDDEEDGEPCDSCEYYFDADEDGELDPEPYPPTDEEEFEV